MPVFVYVKVAVHCSTRLSQWSNPHNVRGLPCFNDKEAFQTQTLNLCMQMKKTR